MARKKYWIGSTGPFLYDDASLYPDTVNHKGFRTEGTIRAEATPTDPNDVVRLFDITSGGSGAAPKTAGYIVISLDSILTNERNLAITGGLTLTDGGANAAVTLGLPSPFTSGNVLSANGSAFVSLTPDAAGLVDKSNSQTGIAGNKTWTGNHIFQTAVDSTTGFQVLDADGGTPIINVDTDNERLGIGVSGASLNKKLVVNGAIRATADESFGGNAQMSWTAGDGMRLQGSGSNSDVSFLNKNGNNVFSVPTGTISCRFDGQLLVATTIIAATHQTRIDKSSNRNWSSTTFTLNTHNDIIFLVDSSAVASFPNCYAAIGLTAGNSGSADGVFALVRNGSGSGDFVFSTSLSGSTCVERMRITSASFLGVGASSPATTGHFRLNNSTSSAVDNIVTIAHASSNTPAANFGSGLLFTLESSTTEEQNAVRLIAETIVATHATRTYRGRLTAYDYTAEREVLRWEADGSAGRFGAFGVTAVVRPTAYTQTYSTATKTHAARTAATLTDNSAGTANTTVEALPDPADTPATADALRDDIVTNLLPALRNNFADLAAQINALKVDSDNTAQFVNQMCDDHQALGWLQ